MVPIFENAVYEWGMNLIIALQSIQNVFFNFVMEFISFFGDQPFYVLFLIILFWCVDEKKGFKLSMIVLFSASINTSIKNYLQVPRPYVANPSVGIGDTHGFSTPSGHSQSSATFYPYVATLLPTKNGKNTLARTGKILIALAIPLIIGFSRVYLGVHYPSDVLLGWTIGFLISAGAILFFPLIEKYIAQLRASFKVLLLAIVTLALNFIGPNDTSMAGAFLGLGIGYILLTEKGGFDAKTGAFWKKLLRLICGATILALLMFVLKLILPGEESANYQLFRFLRYAVIGFSTTFIMPKLFIAMKIALPKEKEESYE